MLLGSPTTWNKSSSPGLMRTLYAKRTLSTPGRGVEPVESGCSEFDPTRATRLPSYSHPLVRWPLRAGWACSVHDPRIGRCLRCITSVGPKMFYHQICKSPIGHHEGAYDFRGVFTVAKGKRTFQPNNRRRARVHGFRLRMRTRAGRAIVSARRRKGRDTLTA